MPRRHFGSEIVSFFVASKAKIKHQTIDTKTYGLGTYLAYNLACLQNDTAQATPANFKKLHHPSPVILFHCNQQFDALAL